MLRSRLVIYGGADIITLLITPLSLRSEEGYGVAVVKNGLGPDVSETKPIKRCSSFLPLGLTARSEGPDSELRPRVFGIAANRRPLGPFVPDVNRHGTTGNAPNRPGRASPLFQATLPLVETDSDSDRSIPNPYKQQKARGPVSKL